MDFIFIVKTQTDMQEYYTLEPRIITKAATIEIHVYFLNIYLFLSRSYKEHTMSQEGMFVTIVIHVASLSSPDMINHYICSKNGFSYE